MRYLTGTGQRFDKKLSGGCFKAGIYYGKAQPFLLEDGGGKGLTLF